MAKIKPSKYVSPKILRGLGNVLEFGKHKGKTVEEVMHIDSNWLHWACREIPDFQLNRNVKLLLPEYKPTRLSEEEYDDTAPW